MSVLNKTYLLIFCEVVAPIAVVVGLIINAVILDIPALPMGIKQNLSWFQQNAQAANIIMIFLYTLAGVLAILAVVLAILISRSKKGAEDVEIGVGFKRERVFK